VKNAEIKVGKSEIGELREHQKGGKKKGKLSKNSCHRGLTPTEEDSMRFLSWEIQVKIYGEAKRTHQAEEKKVVPSLTCSRGGKCRKENGIVLWTLNDLPEKTPRSRKADMDRQPLVEADRLERG